MDSWWFKWFLLKKKNFSDCQVYFQSILILISLPGLMLSQSVSGNPWNPWSILEASLKHPPWLDEFQLINKSPEESPEEFWFGTLFRILYANWSRQKKRKWLLAVLVFLLLLFATNWLLFHIWNHFGYPVITAGLFRQSSWQWIDPSHSI